jgi:hyaluronan synthase
MNIEVRWAGRRVVGLVVAVLTTLGIFWAVRHAVQVAHIRLNGYSALAWAVVYLALFQQYLMSWSDKVKTVKTPAQQARLDALYICVNVPLHNEDPAALEGCLEALLNQSRVPNRIEVVDNCSTVDYAALRLKYEERVRWISIDRKGKRQAQAITFRSQDADIFVTVDSDTILHHQAIEEGIKPFVDPLVMSVAGMELGLNSQANLLSRVADFVHVTWQLTSRSALSAANCVTVNCGTFALYRAEVVHNAMKLYLKETFFGRKIEFSDDSYLTLVALTLGKTVQQPSAICFALKPVRLSHYTRQQIRWMRGSFIRTWWRIRYLPTRSYAFWMQIWSWAQLLVTTALTLYIVLARPGLAGHISPSILAIPFLVTYLMSVRYIMFTRSDQPYRSQLFTYFLAPFVVLWGYLYVRPLRFYAILTCLETGWGTRQEVEVKLQPHAKQVVEELA